MPELHVDGLPDGASALAIVLDDLDHPIQPGFNHWTAWNLPPVCAMSSIARKWMHWHAVAHEGLRIYEAVRQT